MNLQDKIVCAHKGFFNRESEKNRLYRENSKEICGISSATDYVRIIELDLRKSKDGVLYCFHGNLFQYCRQSMFPENFSVLKQKYRVDSLSEILDIISERKVVFLDIKEKTVTREDILNVFLGRKFIEVILANSSVSFLERFISMPKEFVKMMNGNIFYSFYNLGNLKKKGYKYVEAVFPFQIRKSMINKAEKEGLEFVCTWLFFLNKKSYWKKVETYNIRHVWSVFVD